MSNFAYYFAFGSVPSSTVIPHTWFEHVEANLVKTANFTDGSTHAPGSPVIVGGAGMTLHLVGTNDLDVASELDVYGGIDIKASGGMECSGYANFYGSVNFAYSSVSFSGTATFAIGSTLAVEGTATFNSLTAGGIVVSSIQISDSLYTAADSATNLNGTLSVAQAAYFHDDIHLEETTYVEGVLALSGAGAIQERVVIGANADATYSVSSADLVYITQGSITANRIYYLDEAGATNGKKIRFHREDNVTSHTISLRRQSDNFELCLLTWKNTGYIWTDVVRIGGTWKRVAGQFGESAT
jgi:hypothetical protein